jgi:hypothetical protein
VFFHIIIASPPDEALTFLNGIESYELKEFLQKLLVLKDQTDWENNVSKENLLRFMYRKTAHFQQSLGDEIDIAGMFEQLFHEETNFLNTVFKIHSCHSWVCTNNECDKKFVPEVSRMIQQSLLYLTQYNINRFPNVLAALDNHQNENRSRKCSDCSRYMNFKMQSLSCPMLLVIYSAHMKFDQIEKRLQFQKFEYILKALIYYDSEIHHFWAKVFKLEENNLVLYNYDDMKNNGYFFADPSHVVTEDLLSQDVLRPNSSVVMLYYTKVI